MVQTEKMSVVPASKICHGQKKKFFILTKKEKFMAICICITGAEKKWIKKFVYVFPCQSNNTKKIKNCHGKCIYKYTMGLFVKIAMLIYDFFAIIVK